MFLIIIHEYGIEKRTILVFLKQARITGKACIKNVQEAQNSLKRTSVKQCSV